jgi:hypothetical protein
MRGAAVAALLRAVLGVAVWLVVIGLVALAIGLLG